MKSPIFIIALVMAPAFSTWTSQARSSETCSPEVKRPHVILMMADDMGWAQTGYYNHPALKTPNLDAMAANGLRFERFYAGAPVCSPTRATVLTGRTNDRTGVPNHGYPLRLQEQSLPQAMKLAGYSTGHFGKWHLNGIRGPGVPVLAEDDHNPGAFGFDTWLSVTNFFDLNPLMSRQGKFEEFEGDSSEIIVAEALKFITEEHAAGKPTFTVIWFGTPHNPFRALDEDKTKFDDLDAASKDHYGELVAMDRSIGTLRKGLRDLKIADNTLFWFNSDNGGLPKITPSSVGELRGFKGSVYEGGLRVPGVIEWPSEISKPRITMHPAGTVDIFATIADVAGLPVSAMPLGTDGINLRPLFTRDIEKRERPLGFMHQNRGVWLDNQYKLIHMKDEFVLYDLAADPSESTDVATKHPERFAEMKRDFIAWNATVTASRNGEDYPSGKVSPDEPPSRFWTDMEEYRPYFEEWKKRPEYSSRFKKKRQ